MLVNVRYWNFLEIDLQKCLAGDSPENDTDPYANTNKNRRENDTVQEIDLNPEKSTSNSKFYGQK